MVDNAGIRLLGFAGFEASKRFLRSLHDDIWVSRWDRVPIHVDRPKYLNTGDEMRAELERPSSITVLSAHAGDCHGKLCFCGETIGSELTLDKIGTLGATGMLLIDACHGPALAAELQKNQARSGRKIAFLDYGPGKEQFTYGRDSVTVIGSVIRELCYPHEPDLGPRAAERAVKIVNAQSDCRKQVQRPPLRTIEC